MGTTIDKNWFKANKEGLAKLVAGKPKSFILRELIQNAWDEDITICNVDIKYKDGLIELTVEDDSPDGFRDITHTYTLFADTYKRSDFKKRGRFNTGEKYALSLCDKAIIKTTKGTIIFDDNGRNETTSVTKCGSVITMWFKATKDEYDEIVQSVDALLIPKDIIFVVNGKKYKYKKPLRTFHALLLSEITDPKTGVIGKTRRKGEVHVIEKDDDELAYVYEMGIPVQEIDGSYHLDVQQKIPLDQSRETVLPCFLKELYAATLENIHDIVDEEVSGETWVTEGLKSKKVSKDTLKDIITKRYGEKVVVADNFSPNSIDDAKADGYTVLRGTEMPREAWSNVKKHNLISSSSKQFPQYDPKSGNGCVPNEKEKLVGEYAKRIAKRCLGIDIKVEFFSDRNPKAAGARFGGNTLYFNKGKLGKRFFEEAISEETTGLIVHEIGHHDGNHTEMSYHKLLTKLAGKLTMLALNEPEFFDVSKW